MRPLCSPGFGLDAFPNRPHQVTSTAGRYNEGRPLYVTDRPARIFDFAGSERRMYDLTNFRLQDMTACMAALRRLGTGASSLEEAADRITRYLYTNLTTQPNEHPACVLVRLFKTHPYGRLKDRVATLEATLAVQEQSVEVHSSRPDSTLADLRNSC